MKRFGFRKVLGIIFLVVAGTFVFGSIVMLLWNALMPVIFHLPVITFWQGLGLLLLSKILFGGFRGGRGPGHRWKNNMREKWMNMTPEEKEKFKNDWRNRCGGRRFRDHGNPFGGNPFEGDPFAETSPGKTSPEEKNDDKNR